MMTTKYVIQMTIPTRPDLEYFYIGQDKEGNPVFHFNKAKAKRYIFIEEADRDARILNAVKANEILKVISIRCRT